MSQEWGHKSESNIGSKYPTYQRAYQKDHRVRWPTSNMSKPRRGSYFPKGRDFYNRDREKDVKKFCSRDRDGCVGFSSLKVVTQQPFSEKRKKSERKTFQSAVTVPNLFVNLVRRLLGTITSFLSTYRANFLVGSTAKNFFFCNRFSSARIWNAVNSNLHNTFI